METSTNHNNVWGTWCKDYIDMYSDKQQVVRYRNARPDYPQDFIDIICDYVCEGKRKENWCGELALDLACGSGQASRPLSRRFNRVIGMDISAAQIEQAQLDPGKPDNLIYKVGPAEDLSFLDDNSVQLITVATASHWLDLPRFYKEAERVLTKGGVLAIVSYTLMKTDNSRATEEIIKFHDDSPMTPPAEWTTGVGARDVKMPFPEIINIDNLCITEKTTLERMTQMMESWAVYQAYIKENPGSTLLTDVMRKIRVIYEEDNGVDPAMSNKDFPVTMVFPTTMRLGRKK